MQSFRTEIENPLVEKDIIELEQKIRLFHEGAIDPEKFRSLRLARGVYGQRQPGVQMVRIKLPYGKLTAQQLRRIAAVADEYSNGNLHLTTRQDIQVHYVSLDRTPQLWAELERDEITLREACGNTVRNITASPTAGIDPKEPFDVTPYADALFRYFLRNPVGQDLGRKIKIAFSASADDTAFTFMHDVGFLPKVEILEGALVRGFKVVIGGGLGAQPFLAQTAYDFLPADQIIPFTEAVLRVFDRYGERKNRHKARLKYLIGKIGLEQFLQLIGEERIALRNQIFPIIEKAAAPVLPDPAASFTTFKVSGKARYQSWLTTNRIAQKQPGYNGIYIRVQLGNFNTDTARKLAAIVDRHAADDIRITPGQGILLRFVPDRALPALFTALDAIGLAEPGAGSTADITACPGTDTCNLGISSSTGVARALEAVIRNEFPDFIRNRDITIKISGCMNACGQHSLAQIGFHGSSLRHGDAVLPALQVLLGGGATGNGTGRISDKIIKVPGKRGPEVLRVLLNDYCAQATAEENFNAYYDRHGKTYFYELLKPLSSLNNLSAGDFIDWDREERYQPQIGVGECAGVQIDLIQTLLFEAEEKAGWAREALAAQQFADAIYHAYSVYVGTAKALLLADDRAFNSLNEIITVFDQTYSTAVGFHFSEAGFKSDVLQINKNAPEEDFAKQYLASAIQFFHDARETRRTHPPTKLFLS